MLASGGKNGAGSSSLENSNNKNKVLLNMNKKKKMSVISIIIIACVVGSAIGLFGINIWHAFSCSGQTNSDIANIEALTHRLALVEEKAASTTKQTDKLIRMLQKKLLDIDPSSLEELKKESHDEAVRLALSLEWHPAPPMPLFEYEQYSLEGGESKDFLYVDDHKYFNVSSSYKDDLFSAELYGKEKDPDGGVSKTDPADKAVLLLTDAEAEKMCKEWKDKYTVKPGESWGELPSELQQKWLEYSCDYFLMEKNS